MFSKSKINDPIEPAKREEKKPEPPQASAGPSGPAPQTKPKPAPSVISSDLTVTGNLTTAGDLQIEGTIEGDIRAHLLTVGEGAVVSGEIVADDIVVNGHVKGRVRGLKVRLTSTAKVEGDIIHKTIAIESGAHFEGSVQRREDPLGDGQSAPKPVAASPAAPARSEAPAKVNAG